MSLRDFRVRKLVGKGGYGAVYQVMRLADNREYALKVVSIGKMNVEERMRAMNEIRFMASVQHPCLISYYEAFFENNKLFIVMEFAARGDLHALIKKRRSHQEPRYFPEDLVWSVLLQIAFGLQCLHQMSIIHRDIKSSNIFITDRHFVKIGDLGVAKLMEADFAKTMIGTPYFQSPERCVAYEMATLTYPFNGQDYKSLGKKVLQGTHQPIPDLYSKDLSEAIESLLVADVEKRPSIDDFLSLPLLRDKRLLLPKSIVNYSKEQYLASTIELPKTLELAEQYEFPKRPYPEVDAAVLTALNTEIPTPKTDSSLINEILFDESTEASADPKSKSPERKANENATPKARNPGDAQGSEGNDQKDSRDEHLSLPPISRIAQQSGRMSSVFLPKNNFVARRALLLGKEEKSGYEPPGNHQSMPSTLLDPSVHAHHSVPKQRSSGREDTVDKVPYSHPVTRTKFSSEPQLSRQKSRLPVIRTRTSGLKKYNEQIEKAYGVKGEDQKRIHAKAKA